MDGLSKWADRQTGWTKGRTEEIMEGLNRGTNWTVWIDGQSGWTERQMDGGTNGLDKGTDTTEWTDGVDGVYRRTNRPSGWTERTGRQSRRTYGLDGQRDGWVDEWTD